MQNKFRNFFILLAVIVSMTSQAQSGTTCTTAISLGTYSVGQILGFTTTTNSAMWYTFTASETKEKWQIVTKNKYQRRVTDVIAYNNCSLEESGVEKRWVNDSTIEFFYAGLTISNTYYFKLEFSTVSSCTTCIEGGTGYYNILKTAGTTTFTPCNTPSCSANPPCEYVCNGGFEYYNSSPNGLDELGKACGWTNGAAPTTPDFYHSTGASPVDVPCNDNGSQSAHSGNGYAGLLSVLNWREKLETQLSTPLTIFKVYQVSFWLSLADRYLQNLTENFAVEFYLGASVQTVVTVNTSSVDATSWTNFTFTYTSSGSEDMIRIGAQQTLTLTASSNTAASTCTSVVTASPGNYYYIDDISIKEISQLTVVATATAGCSDEPVTITASGANTYTWTGPSSYSATGSSIVVTPTTSVTYTVVGTSTAGCGTTTETITINSITCCTNSLTGNIILRNVNIVPNTGGTPTWTALVAGTTYTGNIEAPASGVISNTLTIRGTFSVNATVTFSLCDMRFSEDQAMQQFAATTIDRSHLYGCDYLWEGIQSRAQLTVMNSYIDDAYFGINAGIFTPSLTSAHGGLVVQNSCFAKNYVGIGVGTCSMSPGNFQIRGTYFMSREPVYNYAVGTIMATIMSNPNTRTIKKLLGSTAHSITTQAIRSAVGIDLYALTSNTTQADFTIGDVNGTASVNATYTNWFDQLNNGITNVRTNTNIYNNKFTNMITTSLGTANGCIYHDNASASPPTTRSKIGDPGGAIPASSYKNVFGHSTHGGSGIKDGVLAYNGGTLTVQNNDFYNISRYGVSAQTWYATTLTAEPITVSANSYTDALYGFYAYDNYSVTALITANTLTQAATTYTNGYNVYINELTKPASATYTINSNNFYRTLNGVYIINTKGARVINNTIQVKKPTTTSVFNAPVTLDNSDQIFIKGNTLSCNTTNSGSWNTYGVFANASRSVTVKCNSITAVSACLKYQSDCSNGEIYYNSLNKTSGADPCLYGVWLDNSAIVNNIGHNGAQWQMSDDIWGDFTGADTYAQNTSTGSTIYYDVTAPKTAADYSPAVNSTPGFPDTSTPFAATTSTNANSQGCTETVRLMNPTLFTSGGGRNVGLNDQPEIMPKKHILLSLSGANANKISGANESNFNTVDSLLDAYIKSRSISILNSAKNANAAISAANNIEQNQKNYNLIYATYLEDDSTVTNGQVSSLRTLAAECPFTDGLAVYQARALLRHYDDSTSYRNACEHREPAGLMNNGKKAAFIKDQVFEKNELLVYPNPVNGQLNVTSGEKGQLFELFDVVGKLILSQKINENETKIDVTSYTNGTYLYKISNPNGEIVKNGKLIIQH
jgi:hypothetical protein